MIERKEIARHVGAHISARRIERGLSMEQVAIKLGISRQAVWYMERGELLPALPRLYALAVVLKCQAWDLLPSVQQVRK